MSMRKRDISSTHAISLRGRLFRLKGVQSYSARVTQAYASAANNLYDYAIAAQFMGLDDTIALFRTTHERLYQLFGEFDEELRCSNRGQSGASPTWAATYSQWMTRQVLCSAS